jgi:hypothetical protein
LTQPGRGGSVRPVGRCTLYQSRLRG